MKCLTIQGFAVKSGIKFAAPDTPDQGTGAPFDPQAALAAARYPSHTGVVFNRAALHDGVIVDADSEDQAALVLLDTPVLRAPNQPAGWQVERCAYLQRSVVGETEVFTTITPETRGVRLLADLSEGFPDGAFTVQGRTALIVMEPGTEVAISGTGTVLPSAPRIYRWDGRVLHVSVRPGEHIPVRAA